MELAGYSNISATSCMIRVGGRLASSENSCMQEEVLQERYAQRTSKLHEKPSTLKREHPALQKMKFINFFSFSHSHFYPLESEYGSRDPIKSGS